MNMVTEPILATGAILAEKFYDTVIPVVDGLDKDQTMAISTGDTVVVDADTGQITIRKRCAAAPSASEAEGA